MLKVAIVVHRFPQLSETFIINQITALLDAGVDVQIFSYYRPDPRQKLHPQFIKYKLQERVHYGVYLPINSLKKYVGFLQMLLQIVIKRNKLTFLNSLNYFKFGNKALNLQYFYRASLFAELNNFDIIHCHFGPIGDDMVQLKRMGILVGKIITSFHGYDYQLPDILREYQNFNSLFTSGNGFIANSKFTYECLIALGCDPAKLTVIPVSASSEIFDKQNNNRSKANESFNILTVARLEEVKGIEYALRATHKLVFEHSLDITYQIIGSGSLDLELKKLTEELSLTARVNFLGSKPQDEVLEAMLNSHVFLLSSVTTKEGASEAQGLVLLEAQSASLPVVASRSGGIPDSLIDGETGFLVPERDDEEIASAILKLYNSLSLRRNMGEKGKFFVKENFDQNKLGKRMLSYYKNILRLH
ncbi:glycosyltransferase [Pontibacter chitinilyticus]|uniref:glycosyltransferase n=1 Tax=Pontibacter chitinilyticus TaxID=2674989 RepID=UPI0032197A28